MPKILIPCHHCEGSGELELSAHLAETFALVVKYPNIGSDAVASALGLNSPNAATNRLCDLILLGLVEREKQGKYWHYSRTKARKTRR